jgi:hypothetical protein
MPDCAYRDFYFWALSDANHQLDTWLQFIGLSKLIQLTVRLVSDHLNDEQWKRLTRHNASLHSYLVHEFISDNLAVGLAYANTANAAIAQRKALLHQFTCTICKNLSGNYPSETLPFETLKAADSISIFAQSLSPGKHVAIVRAYLQQNPTVSSSQIEYAVAPLLAANFNACMATASHAYGFQTREIILNGLYQRYATVDALLLGNRLSLEQVTSYSAYSILLVPTLAYYLEGVAEVMNLRDRIGRIIEDESLAQALYLTALLVRLLNDFGTHLLFQSPDDRQALVGRLYNLAQRGSASQTLNEILLRAAREDRILLTRLKKDIQYGEVNLGLWNLAKVQPVSDAITLFAQRLEYFSQQYTFRFAQLNTLLAHMSDRLGDETFSNIIHRCVRFHEKLYMNPYDVPEGEYAV